MSRNPTYDEHQAELAHELARIQEAAEQAALEAARLPRPAGSPPGTPASRAPLKHTPAPPAKRL
jgi:hypothetical protein